MRKKKTTEIKALLPEQVWKWRALRAESELEYLKIQVAKTRFEAIVASIPALVDARGQIAESKSKINKIETQLAEFKTEVESSNDIDLSNCSIDDVTGRIFTP